MGGLLPEVTEAKNGLMSASLFRLERQYYASGLKSGAFVKLFNIKQYGMGLFYLNAGDFVSNNPSSLFSGFVNINNRSQGNNSVFFKSLKFYGVILYTKWNSDNSVDVYVKMPSASYVCCYLRWISLLEDYRVTMSMKVDESIQESELSKIEL